MVSIFFKKIKKIFFYFGNLIADQQVFLFPLPSLFFGNSNEVKKIKTTTKTLFSVWIFCCERNFSSVNPKDDKSQTSNKKKSGR
jgi:hypothetical protein